MNKLKLALLCVACLLFMAITPIFGTYSMGSYYHPRPVIYKYGYGGYSGGYRSRGFGGAGLTGIFGLLIFLFVLLLLLRVLFNFTG